MNPIDGVKRAAMIGILITVAMYFVGGKIFDVYATVLGPWMILSGVAIWLWFVSGESFKASAGNFFKKIWIFLKKNYYNYRALQKKNQLRFYKK